MANPHPKPTRLKVLEGNPGQRRLNNKEPEPERGVPPMPKHLEKMSYAVEMWKYYSEILDRIGVITEAEMDTLEKYCMLSAQIKDYFEDIADRGNVITIEELDGDGNKFTKSMKANPSVSQMLKAMSEQRQLGTLLGFNPSARAKLTARPGKKKNKFDGLV